MTEKQVRIQLKNDTEANWLSHPMVPLNGELIIYSPDATHGYSRVKIGDGTTAVGSLPFIDSGTINGNAVEIVKYPDYASFPSNGSDDKLYLDLSTNKLYHYTIAYGYSQLFNFNFTITKKSVSTISQWSAGRVPEFELEDNKLILKSGSTPILSYTNSQVVSDITEGGS